MVAARQGAAGRVMIRSGRLGDVSGKLCSHVGSFRRRPWSQRPPIMPIVTSVGVPSMHKILLSTTDTAATAPVTQLQVPRSLSTLTSHVLTNVPLTNARHPTQQETAAAMSHGRCGNGALPTSSAAGGVDLLSSHMTQHAQRHVSHVAAVTTACHLRTVPHLTWTGAMGEPI